VPAAVAGLAAAAVGAYDDVAGAREDQRRDKGLRGHAAALAQGRLSAGVVKVGGIGIGRAAVGGAARVAADRPGGGRRPGGRLRQPAEPARPAPRPRAQGRAARRGRRRRAGAGRCGRRLLPGDVRERTMLGDAGANALGAVLGVALLQRLPAAGARRRALAAALALTAASEVVSYSRVIDAVPPLRALDQLGRLP
jgi:hypothetical protein